MRYGGGIIAGVSTIAAYMYNSHYSSVYYQAGKHRIISFLPTAVIPTLTSILCNMSFNINPLLLGDLDCVICAQTRAVSMHTVLGIGQPLVLAALVQTSLAYSYKNVVVPPIVPLRESFKFHFNIVKATQNKSLALIAANIIVTMIVVHFQAVESITLVHKLSSSIDALK